MALTPTQVEARIIALDALVATLSNRVNTLIGLIGTDVELEAIMRIGVQQHTSADLETLRGWIARIRATPRPI